MNLRKIREWLKQELPILEAGGVIDHETSQRLTSYYALEDLSASSTSIGKIILGVLGASLIGLGVILLFAHNWELLTRPQRTLLAFTPLLVGQSLVLYGYFKRSGSEAWREASSLFLVLSVGACIALISQTYHLGGRLDDFLFVWFWLSVPVIYLTRSSVAAAASLGLFFMWAFEIRFSSFDLLWGWVMLLAIQPYAWYQFLRHPESNRTSLLQWLTVPAFFLIVAHSLDKTNSGMWVVVYGLMLACLYLLDLFNQSVSSVIRRPGKIVSVLGMLWLSVALSFGDIGIHAYRYQEAFSYMGYAFALFFTALFVALLFLGNKRRLLQGQSVHYPFLVFPILVWISYFAPYFASSASLTVFLFNVYLLLTGIFFIRVGIRESKVSCLNGGLAVLALLFGVRFFDSDISFTLKGIVFIIFGIGFLYANFILKRRLLSHDNNRISSGEV